MALPNIMKLMYRNIKVNVDPGTLIILIGLPAMYLVFFGFGFGAQFGQVDVDDLRRDRVIGPAFFDEGNEQRTGFLEGAQAQGVTGGGVGVALHGGVGSNDQHVAGL